MAVSHVISVSTSVSSSSIICAFGAGYVPVAGDYIILLSSIRATGITLNATPANWVNPLGSTVDLESTSHELSIATHFVTSAEATAVTTSYTASSWFSTSQTQSIIGMVWRGVDPNAPLDSIVTAINNTTSLTHTMPALTGSDLNTGSQVVGYVCASNTPTYTDPGGDWTLCAKNAAAQQGRAAYRLGTLTTAGSGVSSQGVTASVTGLSIGVTMALNASGVSTPTVNDAEGLTDSVALERDLIITDTEGLTDSTAVERDFILADSAGLTDSFALERDVAATDSEGLTDNISLERDLVVTDAEDLSDSIALERDSSLTDSQGLTDSTEVERQFVESDNIDLSDSVSVERGSQIDDDLGIDDNISLDRATTLVDNQGLTDPLALDRGFELVDTAGLTDTTLVEIGPQIDDSLDLADDVSIDRGSGIDDLIGMTDEIVALLISDHVELDSELGLTDSIEVFIFTVPTPENTYTVPAESVTASVQVESNTVQLTESTSWATPAESAVHVLETENTTAPASQYL